MNVHKVLHRKLRQPLKIVENVLALAKQIKKKDTSRNLFKGTTKNISFFNCEQLFVLFVDRKIIKISDINYYWISKEGEDKTINKTILRQELYATNDQFS